MTSIFRSLAHRVIPAKPFRWRGLVASGAALLVSSGSLAAQTITWDPGNPTQNPAIGTDGPGTWNSNTANKDFTNGSADVAYAQNDIIVFGVGGTAGTVMVAGTTKNITTLRLNMVTGTAGTNGYIPGYTFTPSSTSSPTVIAPTTLTVNTTPTGTGVQTLTTINDPVTFNVLNFAVAGALSLGGGSTQLGKDGTNNAPPNISAGGVTPAAASTLFLNAVLAPTETYTIGTSIGIGNTTSGANGVQVNAGATLVPTTVTTGALTDLGVGGYAPLNGNGNANGTGLLTINAGGTAMTTGSASFVYIDNNTSAAAPTLNGRLIVNGASTATGTTATPGVLSASYRIVIGNALAADSAHTQSAELDVNGPTGTGTSGGVVYLANSSAIQAGAIYLNNSNIATGNTTAALNIAGGVTTLGQNSGIVFNLNSTAGASTLALTGGSLFLGTGGGGSSGGLTDGSPRGSSATTAVNLSGGVLGAANPWSTTLPINLPGGTATLQTSNLGASNPAAAAPTSTFFNAATASAYNITLNGPLAGVGSLSASGGGVSGGTLSLNAANVYTGSTSVGGGATLLVNAGGSIGSSANANGNVTVSNTGTLVLNGTLGTTANNTGAVTVASGGTLAGTGLLTVASAAVAGTLAPGAPGAATGTLTLNATGGVTLTGTLLLGAAGASPGATSTFLSTTSLLTLSGALLSVNGVLDGVSSYEVATYGSLSGTFASAAPAGYLINYAGSTFAATDIELDPAPIPEPGSLAATAAVAAAALLGRLLAHRPHRPHRFSSPTRC